MHIHTFISVLYFIPPLFYIYFIFYFNTVRDTIPRQSDKFAHKGTCNMSPLGTGVTELATLLCVN